MTHGFRHAALLLISNRGHAELESLAAELRALATDMKASDAAVVWLAEEYGRHVDRLALAGIITSPVADRIKSQGMSSLSAAAAPAAAQPRDLFVMYLPEDRLPVAAPLAVELTKRRVSVAFSEYEIGAEREFQSLIERGLAEHRAGLLLQTPALDRRGWVIPAPDASRFRAVRPDRLDPEQLLASVLSFVRTTVRSVWL